MGKTCKSVALKSHWWGSYLTACKNQKTVMLQEAEGLNKLPPNSLWMMETSTFSYDEFRFISCYGKYLVTEFFDDKSVVLKSCSSWFLRSFLGEWTVARDDRYSPSCFLIKPANLGDSIFLRANQDNSVCNEWCSISSTPWEAHSWEIISISDSDKENERKKDDSTSVSPVPVKPPTSLHVVNNITQNIFQSPSSNEPKTAAGGPYCNSGANVNGSGTQISGDTHYKIEYDLYKQKIFIPK